MIPILLTPSAAPPLPPATVSGVDERDGGFSTVFDTDLMLFGIDDVPLPVPAMAAVILVAEGEVAEADEWRSDLEPATAQPLTDDCGDRMVTDSAAMPIVIASEDMAQPPVVTPDATPLVAALQGMAALDLRPVVDIADRPEATSYAPAQQPVASKADTASLPRIITTVAASAADVPLVEKTPFVEDVSQTFDSLPAPSVHRTASDHLHRVASKTVTERTTALPIRALPQPDPTKTTDVAAQLPTIMPKPAGFDPVDASVAVVSRIADVPTQVDTVASAERLDIPAIAPPPAPVQAGVLELASRLVWSDVMPAPREPIAMDQSANFESSSRSPLPEPYLKPMGPRSTPKVPHIDSPSLEPRQANVPPDGEGQTLLAIPPPDANDTVLPALPDLRIGAQSDPPPIMASRNHPVLASHPSPAAQLHAVLSQADGGGVEMVLAPEELGRLRIEMVPDGDSLRVTIAVERPDTLDMFRRNTDVLLAEIRQAGFLGTQLSFGDWNGPKGSDTAKNQIEDAGTAADPMPSSPIFSRPSRGNTATGAGLDLRL